MLDPMIVPTFNPELHYTRQLRGNTHYPIYQSGRGLGSKLFSIVKSVGPPLLKDVGTQRIMQGKGRTCNIVRKRKQDQNPSTALSMSSKSINSPK